MILGVEHIALSCESVIQGVHHLREIGYQAKFVQEAVPNHPTKKGILTTYDPLHSIAYCQSNRSVALELTQHSAPLDSALSPYQVLFSTAPANVIPFKGETPSCWANIWHTVVGCQQPVAALWEPFRAQFWYDASSPSAPESISIRALLVAVADPSLAEKFWCDGLGCRVVNRGTAENNQHWTRVAFRAPIRTWALDVILAQGDRPESVSHVDASGFPCLALISNHIDKDTQTVAELVGQPALAKFNLEVGGKLLRIVLVHGFDGELIELIEFQRG